MSRCGPALGLLLLVGLSAWTQHHEKPLVTFESPKNAVVPTVFGAGPQRQTRICRQTKFQRITISSHRTLLRGMVLIGKLRADRRASGVKRIGL
jgi:hypothetical protein